MLKLIAVGIGITSLALAGVVYWFFFVPMNHGKNDRSKRTETITEVREDGRMVSKTVITSTSF